MPNRQEKNSRGVNDSEDNYHEFDRWKNVSEPGDFSKKKKREVIEGSVF